MKEMVYKNYMENGQEVIEILDEGIYKSFHYVIVSYGTHPCAYIEIPKDNVSDEDKLIDIDCHGGITYVFTTGLIKPNNENHRDGHWIGWDYAHACEAIDCEDSFEISLLKIKNVAKEEDMSITDLLNLINFA